MRKRGSPSIRVHSLNVTMSRELSSGLPHEWVPLATGLKGCILVHNLQIQDLGSAGKEQGTAACRTAARVEGGQGSQGVCKDGSVTEARPLVQALREAASDKAGTANWMGCHLDSEI